MNKQTIKYIITTTAVITMFSGVLGMLIAFPFLWSNQIGDLVAAGLIFLSGTVLFGTALITLGIMFKKDE